MMTPYAQTFAPAFVRILAASAALSLATPLLAQDTATDGETAAEINAPETEAPDAGADAGAETAPEINAPEAGTDENAGAALDTSLDLGSPVSEDDAAGGEQAGQPYIAEEFGDWQLRCLRAPEGQGEDPCQIYQLLLDPEQNPVAEVTVVALPAGSEAVAGAVVVVPLETQLTEGLRIRVDDGQVVRYDYDFCNRAGCVARFGLSAEQVAQFKRGASGMVSIIPALAPDQRVDLTMSLSGFTAGFDATAARLPQ